VKLVRRAAAVLALALLAQATGCVRIYQPLRGLATPVVIDPQVANLTGVRLTVHCVPGGLLDRLAADELCRKVGVVFENQGAIVTTIAAATGVESGVGEVAEAPQAAPETDLLLELRARKIHQAQNPMVWLLCFATLTIVPASTEYTFAQDVVVRDGTGFLLAQETLQGRIVQQFGVAAWVGNGLFNAVWRKPEDEISDDALRRDLSSDLYRQLSQAVFNAKMQWLVLQQAPPAPGRR
jgi:hypothetical protein